MGQTQERVRGGSLLGQLLVASGAITEGDLAEALAQQNAGGGQLGQLLVGLGALAPRQLERALRTQSRLRAELMGDRGLILVVDDDPEVGALLADVFTGAGYRVLVAGDEVAAIAALTSGGGVRPALIVLDLGLPGCGGAGLLAVLRSSGVESGRPVIVLSGQPDPKAEVEARGLQVSRVLSKPVSARTLLATVESVLQEDPQVGVAAPVQGGQPASTPAQDAH